MKFSRRNFVKLSGAAALGGLGISGLTFARSPEADVLDGLSADSFRRLIGNQFQLMNDSGPVSARLVKVGSFNSSAKDADCFSLVFEIGDESVGQGTFYVFSQQTGTFELFMSEGKSGKSKALVAVINRI